VLKQGLVKKGETLLQNLHPQSRTDYLEYLDYDEVSKLLPDPKSKANEKKAKKRSGKTKNRTGANFTNKSYMLRFFDSSNAVLGMAFTPPPP
jgi:hypothetical protein